MPTMRTTPTATMKPMKPTGDAVASVLDKELDLLCSSSNHSAGTSAGAPLSLIKNTRNFAGLAPLAFRSTT
jgi:hypothetical protein